MLHSIKKFFADKLQPEKDDAEHALRLATAALLIEVMRMDGRVQAAERQQVVRLLTHQFGLEATQVEKLIALAEEEATKASDYHQFTSLINRSYKAADKVKVIERLWQVAYADGHLDKHEEHLVRKISRLIGVPHKDFIAAKQRARDG